MSCQEIREFFYREGLIDFDETPCERFSLEEDLTEEAWAIFRRRARIPADMPPLTALKNLHLLTDDGKMTHAGAWLLARDIRKFTISADVACALFMGTDKVHILDRRGFNGDVYSMIDEVLAWLLSKLNIAYIIKHVKRGAPRAARGGAARGGGQRPGASRLPLHRQRPCLRVQGSGRGGQPRRPARRDERGEPGHQERMEAVEHIGSGIRRIRRLYAEYGVAEPETEVSPHWFVLRFPRRDMADEGGQGRLGPDTTEVGDQVGTKWEPSRDQVDVMLACAEARPIGDLMDTVGRANRTKFRDQVLSPLLEAGLMEMTIPDKPRSSKQGYRLTERGRRYLQEHAPEQNHKDA